ncbi:MAG: hypothetical protein QF475_02365 [Candidatus Undinarchaeales archaeon]|jgi:hypothetical protein|nr:hypothetical protein [Candidatus Undinarchaeales archaeon]
MDKKSIQDRLLKNLMEFKPPKWGGCHTEERNMLKILPRHSIGTKRVRTAVKELYNLGFILRMKKTNELHVSLNPRKKKEIYHFLGISYYDTSLYQNGKFYKEER